MDQNEHLKGLGDRKLTEFIAFKLWEIRDLLQDLVRLQSGVSQPIQEQIQERTPNPSHDACCGTGKLPDGVKCWCWK